MKKKQAVSKGRQDMTAKPAAVVGRLPSETEILELAELASYVFERPEAAGLRRTLEHTSFVHLGLLKVRNKPIIAYLLHLILHCPQMIRRPRASNGFSMSSNTSCCGGGQKRRWTMNFGSLSSWSNGLCGRDGRGTELAISFGIISSLI